MGAFLGSVLGGANSTLNSTIGKAGDLSQYGTNLGEGDTNTASDFYKSILSGDPTKIGQVIGPQERAIQQQGQQRKQTLAQFGNRSGGTNATAQTVDDTTRQSIDDLISHLTAGSVSGLQNIGSEGLNLGLSANQQQSQLAQQRMENWKNSVLGQGITGAVNYAESFLPVAHGGNI